MRFGDQRMHIEALSIKVLSPPAPVGFVTVKGRTLTLLAQRFIECTRKVVHSETARAPSRRC